MIHPPYSSLYDNGPHTHTHTQLVCDFISAEKAVDPRPIVLYGLSAGGMLAYHVAAAVASDHSIAGIVGMSFLDQRQQKVRVSSRNVTFTSHCKENLGRKLEALTTPA